MNSTALAIHSRHNHGVLNEIFLSAADMARLDHRIKKEWIYKYCTPSKDVKAKYGTINVYCPAHVLSVISKRHSEIKKNTALASTPKNNALKTLENMEVAVRRLMDGRQ